MADWIDGKVVAINHFTENLFSLRVHANVAPFLAGQFIKLAMHTNGQRVARAYSYLNAPNDPNLEFYIAKIPAGKLTPLLHQLRVNDTVKLTRAPTGYFTLNEIPTAKILWLLSTGTGVAPYLSMLQQGDDLSRFKKIVLVHAVRYQNELSYLPLMKTLRAQLPHLTIQPVVSREPAPGALCGRIPQLISSGALEKAVGLPIEPTNTHIMLCGNPAMIADAQTVLKNEKQMKKNLRRAPGDFTSELYW